MVVCCGVGALKPTGSEGLVAILKLSFSSLSTYYRHLAAARRAPMSPIRKGGGGAFVDENYNEKCVNRNASHSALLAVMRPGNAATRKGVSGWHRRPGTRPYVAAAASAANGDQIAADRLRSFAQQNSPPTPNPRNGPATCPAAPQRHSSCTPRFLRNWMKASALTKIESGIPSTARAFE